MFETIKKYSGPIAKQKFITEVIRDVKVAQAASREEVLPGKLQIKAELDHKLHGSEVWTIVLEVDGSGIKPTLMEMRSGNFWKTYYEADFNEQLFPVQPEFKTVKEFKKFLMTEVLSYSNRGC